MKGYKVVMEVNGSYFSILFSSNVTGGKRGNIIYKLGEKTERLEGWGPLAVFKDETLAREFIKDTHSILEELYFLFEREYKTKLVLAECEFEESKDSTYWYIRDGEKIEKVGNLPEGKCFADSVTLTKIL
jgi:hypothetical protein